MSKWNFPRPSRIGAAAPGNSGSNPAAPLAPRAAPFDRQEALAPANVQALRGFETCQN